MENISEILDEQCVALDLGARRKIEAIEELVGLLESAGKIEGAASYVKELLEREKLSSTGIGQGVAIPHKLTPGVSRTIMAFGRKLKGIPFDSIDKKPAHLIFLILGPQGQHTGHLRILSKLSRLLHDRSFFEALMRAGSAAQVLELIRERERI